MQPELSFLEVGDLREQAYRDPVHGFIKVTDENIQRLIDTREFQRLRRIRQLGASYGTYHGAEHSRFGHSIGAMWIMHGVLERLVNTGFSVPEDVQITSLCAALLHDLGHGPFSHALENRLTPGVGHEDWSIRIILGDTEVNQVLRTVDATLPDKVAAVLDGTSDGPHYMMELVSSQLDVDRMDYLLRDSLYTGVTYGRFDLHRVINTLQLSDDRIVVQAKGVVAIEEYVLARYFMYWQVYFHKATRSQELLLRSIWRRAVQLWRAGRLGIEHTGGRLDTLLSGAGVTLEDYLAVDDYDIVCALKTWRLHEDKVLVDLANRYLDRRLLKPVFKAPHAGEVADRLDEARAIVERQGWDPEYYLLIDHTCDLTYDIYLEDENAADHKPPIMALDERARPVEIAKLSATIQAVASKSREAVNVYVPQDAVDAVRELFYR